MFLRTLISTVLTVGIIESSTVQAQTYRLPISGNPALVVNVPTGWSAHLNQFGNLAIRSGNNNCAIQLAMVSDPRVETTSTSEIAANFFKYAGALPYTRTEPGMIGNFPGEAFVGSLTNDKGIVLQMRVVIVRLDKSHYASLGTLIWPSITPRQQADLSKLCGRITIAVR